jgi:hypothetical protein
MKKFLVLLLMLSNSVFSQNDLDKLLKASEVLLTGFTIFKSTNNTKNDSKTISSVCIKNRLEDKITFKLFGKDDQDNKVEKELIVQNDGKECVFNIPKGVYNYEIILSNKEIYKKGEYKFDDDVVITIKKDN